MLRLNISQQYGRIELNTTRPVLELRTTRPKLNIQTTPAKLEIRQVRGTLEIDQTPCRASIGLKTPMELARDIAELGRRTAAETTVRICEEGDRLAAIESGEDAIVNIATEKNFPPPPEIVLARIDPPIIRYTAHAPEFNPIPGRVDTALERGVVDSQLVRGQVVVRMAQYPSVKMWVTGSTTDVLA